MLDSSEITFQREQGNPVIESEFSDPLPDKVKISKRHKIILLSEKLSFVPLVSVFKIHIIYACVIQTPVVSF